MGNNITYKQVKINWLIIAIFMGCEAYMILSYINQWGNNPINKPGLIILTFILCVFPLIFLWRFKVTIDNKFIIFGSDLWTSCKILLAKIESVSTEQITKETKLDYYFVFLLNQAIIINLKNGITYRIAIKNAERVKEEIEKRMITTND